MPEDLQRLVRETIELTGEAPPRLLDEDAPTLAGNEGARGFYLVGLIGGKEVGKSAMVNALAGQNISAVTSHGAGTDSVVAYAHSSHEQSLRDLLEQEAPGQFRIVTHDIASEKARVLLDLPDIDSHFQSHLLLTRRMLRHMLYPIWLVSVEKYADARPRQMLVRVAEGNDPRNFIFVLNKADQVDEAAVNEIRDDYARRLGTAMGIDPPRVWVVSAQVPASYDLPALRKMLSRDRSDEQVQSDRQMAGHRRDASLLRWLDERNLPARAQRLGRLLTEAQDLMAARLASPLLDRSLPHLAQDAAYRASLVDEAMSARIARWPLVNLVHTLLSPVLSAAVALVRGGTARAMGTNEGLVDAHLAIDGQALHDVIRATFAHIHQTSPVVATIYAQRRPWEPRDAEMAAMKLRTAAIETIEHQRAEVITRLGSSHNPLAALVRWALTIGALLWFPFIQPLLEAMLRPNFGQTMDEFALLFVRLLGTTYLLTTAAFLVLYFLVLWLALRWSTQRRVGKLLAYWARGEGPDELDLSRQIFLWVDDLLDPLQGEFDKAEGLAKRVSESKVAINAAI